MGIFQSIAGSLTIELTGADPIDTLRTMEKSEIFAEELERVNDLQIRMRIDRRDYERLCRLCEKRGDKLTVLNRVGLFWHLCSLRNRSVLLLGLTCMLLLSVWLPTRILFVQIEGNVLVPTQQIVETASNCGIHFGAYRRSVRSESIKNALLEAMPQLSWVGVNTKGCVAIISVRERENREMNQSHPGVSSIVASQDGVIREVTVLRGSAACTIGQRVQAGDLLISGYTDCGICIRGTKADGEVFAETSRNLTAVMPSIFRMRLQKTETKTNYALIIGKKRINFANSSGISGSTCAKIYEEKYLTLPGGFVLPVALAIETTTYYETDLQSSGSSEAALSSYGKSYLLRQMQAGIIENGTERFAQTNEVLLLEAQFACCEMIGITRLEENLPNYGKND